MTGMFNAENKKIIPLITNNTMNLTFSPTLDLRNEDSDYYYKGAGYIVTYMMVAPIDLRDAEEISIYLKGHDGVGNSHYYKSKGKLEKPNLTANMFYQWTSADNSDNAAIVFDKITVQDWEKDVIYSNGEEGTGTSTW